MHAFCQLVSWHIFNTHHMLHAQHVPHFHTHTHCHHATHTYSTTEHHTFLSFHYRPVRFYCAPLVLFQWSRGVRTILVRIAQDRTELPRCFQQNAGKYNITARVHVHVCVPMRAYVCVRMCAFYAFWFVLVHHHTTKQTSKQATFSLSLLTPHNRHSMLQETVIQQFWSCWCKR